ncbi:MAG: metallophosphoesterase [Clostridia bacterium]|nr:metallophosphoesterase [Clostridia bacterium]
MKKILIRISSIILIVSLLIALALTAFAGSDAFAQDAYVNIVTFSDCQQYGTGAYKNFGNVLKVMKDDGMPQPDSLLMGGDYTKILFDYATPGMIQLREHYVNTYPQGDPDDIICIQGNHDQKVAGFYPTGMYDMGTYQLFVMNEDDFPWKQSKSSKKEDIVKATAEKLDAALSSMISADDLRPVIILTHVPLHHTTRNSAGDNMYASYIFNVLNKAAEKLDIIFIFGHNHSGTHDDYIGGSVNYMAPGDSIRIPLPDKTGEDCYTNETLNFTYTNCGYIGYAENSETDTSTNVLTLGAIRFFADKFVILKYTKDGLFREDTVERINPADESEMQAATGAKNMQRNNQSLWEFELSFFGPIIRFFINLFA